MTVIRPKAILHQSVAASAASLSMLANAAVASWVTPLLPRFIGPNSEIPMNSDEASWMVALFNVGLLFGPLPAGVLADYIGRKIVLLSSAPLSLIGWVIILYYRSLPELIVGRIVQAFAVGIVYTVLPMYLGEISIPKFRGAVTSTFYCFWWFGFLFEYITGPNLLFDNFTYVTAALNVVFFLAFLWPPESPYYYLMKNNEDKARKALSWLFSSTEEETDKEIERMKQGSSEKKVAFKELVANAPNRKALMIVLLNGYIRVFCGLLPLSIYSTLTLKSAGSDFFISPDNVTIIMGVMMFVGTVCSSFTLDTFGRKPLLLWSSFISGITMLLVGIFYFLNSKTTVNVSSFGWVLSIGFIVFSAVSVVGIFPVSTAYQSELFDSSTRASASVVLNVYTTILSFIVFKYYLTISTAVGTYVNFVVFTITCFFSVYLSWFVMPETKGKSFEQIRKELHNL